jgi:transcriptional regulator with XRE-family HTH domain
VAGRVSKAVEGYAAYALILRRLGMDRYTEPAPLLEAAMSFGDVAARLRSKKEAQQDAPEKPRDFRELYTVRARILGVLIKDARAAKGLSESDCATEVGIPLEYYREWELGVRAPTLPQLEMLAYYVGVPVSRFWDTKTIGAEQEARHVPNEAYTDLRDRVVGTQLRVARKEAALSQEELAAATGLNVGDIDAYELGQHAIPGTDLTSLASGV